MDKTRITVVRHGETEWNVAMQLQGHQNSPLTTNGIAQAEKLAETIKNRTFGALFSSDLGRTLDTSNIINKHLNLEILEDKSLRERAYGVMEGLTREEIKAIYPEVHNAYLERNIDYNIPEGESLRQFNMRVIQGLQSIADNNIGKHILIVAHGGILDCIIRRIFNIELDVQRSFIIPNTSVNTFTIDGSEWILEEWGNVEHLNTAKVLDEL